MHKLKKGDKVKIITGRDKGKVGTILRIVDKKSQDKSKGHKLIVEGINIVKKTKKANPSKDEKGGIIEKEAVIHMSNVAILNESTNKVDKIGFKLLEDGRKVRFFKSNDEVIDV